MNFNNLRNRDKSLILRNNFRSWKFTSLSEAGYFVIFQGFAESYKLKKISGNALKLYVYLGIHANNYEGIVWHCNETIAKYFEKSERTIRTWMKELEDMQLIKRMRLKYDGRVYTYMQPYMAKSEKDKYNIEGILYFNDYGEFCFQDQYTSYVLREETYIINLFIDNLGIVKGLLQKKSQIVNKENKEYYIFESERKELKMKFDYNINPGLMIRCVMIV